MTIAFAIALNAVAAVLLLTLLTVAMRLPHLVADRPSKAGLRRAQKRASRHGAVRSGARAHSGTRRREPLYSPSR